MLKNITYGIRAHNYPTESSIKADIAKRDTAVASILQASKGKTVTEKLEYFNDWLTHNNEYNTFPSLGVLQSRGTYPQAWACISALEGREGERGPVCEGYAEAFKVLCDKAGIPCVLVDGIGYSGWSAEGHMWNNVKVGGSWYAVDVTWNDSSKGGSGKVTGNESRDWLLLGSESRDPDGATFSETHRIANLVMHDGASFLNGPVLSATAYPGYGHKVQDTDEGDPDSWDESEEPEAQAPISIGKAAVTVGSKTWTGKALGPVSLTVKLNGKTLRKGTDYTISCKGGKKVGSYKVTVKGKGAYTGTKTATFKILPKGTSVSKLSKAKRGFTVKWKKPSKKARSQIDGYQVRCSTKSNMKGAKTLKAKGASKTSAKVSKLKGGKTYYVQVRSYKKVGGKTYYSGWSKAKTVKTKK
ncbi:fibronectin type III domain-containing protein [uncultured Adlercreutzia sp.]|uniref:fibronectin type III domain-containing protein n=1 Tax=uncultured Adlercreutzia sp. TaxID=875803 RepID=UPI00272E5666|nr:fibronectin type III domain-containing protein [uncultured Adlercreutzia sp.]